jgi:hypothetical protein
MPNPQITTVKEALFWTYANLGMAQAGHIDGSERYGVKHFAIRSRLYYGLLRGTINLGALAKDEKLKMRLPQCCSYCGSIDKDHLAVDHLIPLKKGGDDDGDNFVWACRSCNSSKHDTDLLTWYKLKQAFPPLYVLRRYIKLAIEYCAEEGLLDKKLSEVNGSRVAIHEIPLDFPNPNEVCLFIPAKD